jgi:hypothetical protein
LKLRRTLWTRGKPNKQGAAKDSPKAARYEVGLVAHLESTEMPSFIPANIFLGLFT